MTAARGSMAVVAARSLIGRRVHWGDGRDPDSGGTIVDIVMTRNAYVRWVIEWDEGAPPWWAPVINPNARHLILEDLS